MNKGWGQTNGYGLWLLFFVLPSVFRVLTLVVGWQERHLALKTLVLLITDVLFCEGVSAVDESYNTNV